MGDRRIGVAVSDPSGILASPLTIIERTEESASIEAIADLVKKQSAGVIIVGLPRSLDGSIGSQAQKTMDFAEKLRDRINVPVEFRDERWTSVEARELMRESRPGKKGNRAKDDAVAAAIILQGYLDEKHIPAD